MLLCVLTADTPAGGDSQRAEDRESAPEAAATRGSKHVSLGRAGVVCSCCTCDHAYAQFEVWSVDSIGMV